MGKTRGKWLYVVVVCVFFTKDVRYAPYINEIYVKYVCVFLEIIWRYGKKSKWNYTVMGEKWPESNGDPKSLIRDQEFSCGRHRKR